MRRIEALTGAAAEAHVAGEEALLRQAASALRTAPAELPARLSRLIEENRRLERELAEARRALAMPAALGRPASAAAKRIGDVAYEARLVEDVPGRELRGLADDLKRRIGSGIVAIVSRAEGKAAIVVGVTKDLTDRFDAVELVRAGAEALGGKGGGGRADMAQAGGPGRTVPRRRWKRSNRRCGSGQREGAARRGHEGATALAVLHIGPPAKIRTIRRWLNCARRRRSRGARRTAANAESSTPEAALSDDKRGSGRDGGRPRRAAGPSPSPQPGGSG